MSPSPLFVRRHGDAGPCVVVLHGGPGAPGSAGGLARGLADGFCVVEPFQRRAGDVPLTVAQHVVDLRDVILTHCPDEPPSLVGSSWGAMLALAYAAERPDRLSRLALVGCGSFDLHARARLNAILEDRMGGPLRRRLATLEDEIDDPDERLATIGRLIEPLYAVDHLESDGDSEPCDARGHAETWEDMIRLQHDGTYPAAFSAIEAPVLMLHGDHDPHPGSLIRDSLLPVLHQLRYVELSSCGHYPWRERGARDLFFETLRPWLLEG